MVGAYADGFIGELPDADSTNKVTSYKNNVNDHILEHYEIFVRTADRLKLTSHQLLYYHTYGDYRLILNDENRPRFIYRTYNNTVENPSLMDLAGGPTNDYFLNTYLTNETDDVINGVFREIDRAGNLTQDFDRVHWLNRELENEGTGSKFNLPSLGTEAIKVHAFGNASDTLRNALITEMDALTDFWEDIHSDLEPTVFSDLNVLTGLTDDELDMDSPPSPIAAILTRAVLSNPEYVSLSGRGLVLPDPAGIERTMIRTYRAENEYSDYERNSAVANALFKFSTQKFYPGDNVHLDERNVNDSVLDAIASQGNWEREDVAAALYQVRDFDPDALATHERGYHLDIVDLPLNQEEINVDNPAHPGSPLVFKENQLYKAVGYDPSGDVTIKKGKKGKVVLPPQLIVMQRIILDTFFAIQSLIHLSHRYGNVDRNETKRRSKSELKMRWLSNGVNVYSTDGLFDSKQKKLKVRPMDVQNAFPNIIHFNETRPSGERAGNKASERKAGMLDELAKMRSYYTLSSLSQIRKKSIDKASMDAFYSKSILLQEIGWLSRALGDSAKVLHRKEEQVDLMAQLQYEAVERTPDFVQQTADAPKKTIFYEVDMPLIKDVIMTYQQAYNNATISKAFNVPIGKPAEENNLAQGIWGSVQARAVGIFDMEGVLPHKFMEQLFSNMDEALAASNIMRSHFPSTWMGTNLVSKLQTDPVQLGETIERRFYSEKLKEYIEHLRSLYFQNYIVPSVIITTLENAKVNYTKNMDALKLAFLERLEKDSKRSKLVTTNFVFRPYGITIAIMRSAVSIPVDIRDEYVAEKIDTQMRDDIQSKLYHGTITPIVPQTHPKWKEGEAIPEITPPPVSPSLPPVINTPTLPPPPSIPSTPTGPTTIKIIPPRPFNPVPPHPENKPTTEIVILDEIVDAGKEDYASLEWNPKAVVTDENGRYKLENPSPKNFSMKPDILQEPGIWSLADITYLDEKDITNRLGPIGNQGKTSSCAAFATTGLQDWYEGKIKSPLWVYHQHLLNKPLIDAIHSNLPSKSSSHSILIEAEINGGSPSEIDYPFPSKAINKEVLNAKYTKEKVQEGKAKATHPTFESTKEDPQAWYRRVSGTDKEQIWMAICSSISHGIPLYTAMHATPLQGLRGKEFAIINKPTKEKDGHAVVIIGVGKFHETERTVSKLKDTPRLEKEIKENPFKSKKLTYKELNKRIKQLLRKDDLGILNKKLIKGMYKVKRGKDGKWHIRVTNMTDFPESIAVNYEAIEHMLQVMQRGPEKFPTTKKFVDFKVKLAYQSNQKAKELIEAGKEQNDPEVVEHRDVKNQLLEMAMRIAPHLFYVDQPSGTDDPKDRQYPGVTYKPMNWRFHIKFSHLPKNIEGTDKIHPDDQSKLDFKTLELVTPTDETDVEPDVEPETIDIVPEMTIIVDDDPPSPEETAKLPYRRWVQIQNSWGSRWGRNGILWIEFDSFCNAVLGGRFTSVGYAEVTATPKQSDFQKKDDFQKMEVPA